jgi:isoquinoline 1-oxidoreductase alpha subunit
VQVRSCSGINITTIEGLSADGSHPVQRAWEEMSVPQCGYCQPGQMLALTGLLNQTKQPTDEQIDAVMSQQLCRCGTYHRIENAVKRAIELSNQ